MKKYRVLLPKLNKGVRNENERKRHGNENFNLTGGLQMENPNQTV